MRVTTHGMRAGQGKAYVLLYDAARGRRQHIAPGGPVVAPRRGVRWYADGASPGAVALDLRPRRKTMVHVPDLWLPILVASALVFVDERAHLDGAAVAQEGCRRHAG